MKPPEPLTVVPCAWVAACPLCGWEGKPKPMRLLAVQDAFVHGWNCAQVIRDEPS